MPQVVTDCPRCKARHVTFDVLAANPCGIQYRWQRWFESFSICRRCHKATVFYFSQKEIGDEDEIRQKGVTGIQGSMNDYFSVEGHISLKDESSTEPPEFLPENIDRAFREGASCLAIGCFNAAATMFRLCVDLTTKPMLPGEGTQDLSKSVRRNLGLRLPWLFDTGKLPEALRDLSSCIKDDGNDGAHEGTLTKEDAEDTLDFTFALLERIFTEPERLRLAKERRDERRQKKDT